MGLDMYLKGRRYLSRFDDDDKKIAHNLQKQFPELGNQTSHFGGAMILEVSIDVGYWRKANAIHGWFVREVQGGIDDCKSYDVSRTDLTNFRALCLRVLNFKHLANELLPNVEGFFFGGQEYDEGYYADLENTVAIIDKALALPENWEFEYQSSW